MQIEVHWTECRYHPGAARLHHREMRTLRAPFRQPDFGSFCPAPGKASNTWLKATSVSADGPIRSFAEAVADDMYAAIDALADKLDRQVRRHKAKVTDHHRASRPADAGLMSAD